MVYDKLKNNCIPCECGCDCIVVTGEYEKKGSYYAHCFECDAEGPRGDNFKEATDLWNRQRKT